ncbi:MAG: FtsQ-type POTRA domain-containing protein [Deltaproteobacteria bacterium]|nr:FtsQ-type POTRA domain-containing protein [Deltaproteobacteria bacterium]MBW2361462.1 FtsQ-type POTRA domain-containing protein [Deltaproteobacteria bacterium]
MKTRRPPSQRMRRIARWLTWTAAALTGLAAGAFGWNQLGNRVAPQHTAVATLEISGNQRVAPEALAALAGIRPGTPLGAVDLEAVRQRIASHPWIASARVTALPPRRLLVGVEERTPRALTRSADGMRFVDGSGVAFAPAPATGGIPELRRTPSFGAAPDSQAALATQTPDPDLVAGIQVLDGLAREGLPAPLHVEVGPDEAGSHPAFAWRRGETLQRVVLGEGQLETKLARLARLVQADLRQAREAAQLDLRFRGRVILRPQGDETVAEVTEDDDRPLGQGV